MENRDLGVQPDYVERAFKVVEVLSTSATAEAKEYFLSRVTALEDLEHIRANRPLQPPGNPGWRFAPPPHVAAHLGKKAFLAWKRLQET